MSDELQATSGCHWTESLGIRFIIRSFALAVQPSAWCLAVVGIVLTVVWGGLLDVIWSPQGGIADSAIQQTFAAAGSGESHTEPAGDLGIFEVFKKHEAAAVTGLMSLSSPGADTAAPVSRVGCLIAMGQGVGWMFSAHPLYALLFFAGALLIWSVSGGAICRMAAVALTTDERITAIDAWEYVKPRLFGGFVLAPCIPLVFVLVVAILLALGGLVMGIPVLGDLLGGMAFGLAILGGGVVVALLLGLGLGGSLLWPAVAVDGSDSFDAFSRSVSYVFTKPWKTGLYAVGTFVLGALCWWGVRWGLFAALSVTRAVAGFGMSLFGWWGRGEDGSNKLERIWAIAGPGSLHAWPDWSQLAWYECLSAVLVGLAVLLAISFVWGFLASFYFSGSTAVYLLLRHDVDATDFGDLYEDDDALAAAPTESLAGGTESTAKSEPEDPKPDKT